jgi:hypothetical protein
MIGLLKGVAGMVFASESAVDCGIFVRELRHQLKNLEKKEGPPNFQFSPEI